MTGRFFWGNKGTIPAMLPFGESLAPAASLIIMLRRLQIRLSCYFISVSFALAIRA
jgi:hypothetical protein